MTDSVGEIWITGLGAVSPGGWTAKDTWDHVVEGRSGVHRLDRFPLQGAATQVCGTVPGAEADGDDALSLRFARSAVAEALDQALLGDEVIDLAVVANHGERRLPASDRSSLIVSGASLAREVARQANAARELGVYGACAGGSLAIGTGYKALQAGLGETAIVGGADCLLREFDFFQFCNLYAMTSRECPPEEACCPFDRRRDGFILSEGAAFLVLETEAHARRRGAEPLARIGGFGSAQNAYHIVASPPDALGPANAMAQALADARLDASDVDYINAHGTSTRDNDWCETLAIRKVFGGDADATPVSSSKSEIGHTMAAAGAIEAVISIMALRAGVVPPTINLSEPDERCDLDYVPWDARERPLRSVLSNSFGFGGHSTSLLLRAVA